MNVSGFINALIAVAAGYLAGAVTVQLVAPDLLSRLTAPDLPEALTARLVSAGDFRDIDTVYRARGRAQILQGSDISILRFTEFAVTPGPDLQVWLSQDRDIWFSGDVAAARVQPLGPLKQTTGDQVYLLPEGLELSQWRSAIIWSDSARVLVAAADLEGR